MSTLNAQSTAEDATAGLDLSGSTFLVTGATSGIGTETVRVLALRGAHVIATGRTAEKAQRTLDSLGIAGTAVACELSEPASVKSAVDTVLSTGRKLQGIIANAGIMALPERQVKHGMELQFLTNHLGHALLIDGLLPALTPTGRVVILSSGAHHMAPAEGIDLDNLDGAKHYEGWAAYGQSKLANLLYAKALSTRLPEPNQNALSVHPGVIETNLLRHRDDGEAVLDSVGRDRIKSIPQGAATTVFAATHPRVAKLSGAYLADCNIAKTSRHGRDDALAETLYTLTQDWIAAA